MFEIVEDQAGKDRRQANAQYSLRQLLCLPIVFMNVVLIIEYGWVIGLASALSMNIVIGLLLGALGGKRRVGR